MSLKTERNTVSVERDVISVATRELQFNGPHHHLQVDFEHGQWWVTCKDCGMQWSVVDVQGAYKGLGLECVTGSLDGCDERADKQRRKA